MERHERVRWIVLLLLTLSGTAVGRHAAGQVPTAGRQVQGDGAAEATDERTFRPMDVFGLEWATDPRVAPDGPEVVYVRNAFDVMTDGTVSDLWLVGGDGEQRPLTGGDGSARSPRWSPSGDRLAYVSSRDGGSEIWVRWMDTGQEAKVTSVAESPGALDWSPDGASIAFTMFVPDPDPSFTSMPRKPEGAEWAEPPVVIDDLQWRADGSSGFVRDGATHLFVVPADGGTPRQLTFGQADHGSPAWTPDGRHVLVSANRRQDRDDHPNDSEIFEVAVVDGSIRALTERYGPDGSPQVSPDGERIAYTGFDDALQGYQVTRLYVMDRDGSDSRVVTDGLDRDVGGHAWASDGSGLYIQYDDKGVGHVGFVALDGEVEEIAADLGGTSLGRPYGGGSFTVSRTGTIAFTHGDATRPADVARVDRGGEVRRLTRLNEDLLAHKTLGQVEEIWWESSHDGRRIQGWIVTPPDFDASRLYPLVLEIHGGPFADYGPRFAAEIQLYASAGYVVLYTNPRGSTSYGEEFGNLIHHAYPGDDYHDLMSGVDAVLERGYVDPDRLYVTGGSGGGVLTAWIVGTTDRFQAAAVQKPVINWASFVLHADATPFFSRYWFPGFPWEHPEHYWARSPLSRVGNVTTPTMLITGEQDYRTPMSETEQYYAALKLQGVPSVMVRVPGASHGIANRPSNLVAKVLHILEWFERYGGEASLLASGGAAGGP